MATGVTQLVSEVRDLSSLFNNPFFSDNQIVNFINDGGQEFYDWMISVYETYFLTKVDFSLPFAGQTDPNVFPMPIDLIKDNTLERNPTTTGRSLVPRLGSWSDRFNVSNWGFCGGRKYYPAGNNLMVFPPSNSAGNYRLWYTPRWSQLSEAQSIPPAVVGTPAVLSGVVTGTGTYSFSGAAFTAANVGDTLIVFGALDAVNNGSFPITVILTPDSVTTTNTASVSGVVSAATATLQPAGTAQFMPEAMTPWELGPKIHAALAIRQARQQDASGLDTKLAALKQRIVSAAANRTEEVPQSPLRDGWGRGFGGDRG